MNEMKTTTLERMVWLVHLPVLAMSLLVVSRLPSCSLRVLSVAENKTLVFPPPHSPASTGPRPRPTEVMKYASCILFKIRVRSGGEWRRSLDEKKI